MTTVLLAGATGMLGNRIAVHLLEDPEVELRLLVRAGTLEHPLKRRALEPLIEAGALLREGDVGDPAGLHEPTRDVDVVVSALQGDAEIMIDGQVALATAAKAQRRPALPAVGLRRGPAKATPGEHASFDLRRTADEQIAALGLEQVNVLCGAFLDGIATRGAIVDRPASRHGGLLGHRPRALRRDDGRRRRTLRSGPTAVPTSAAAVAASATCAAGPTNGEPLTTVRVR